MTTPTTHPLPQPAADPADGPPPVAAAQFSALAVSGFILAVLWLGGLGSVAALVVGAVAIRRIRRLRQRGAALAVAALVVGALGAVAAGAGVAYLVADGAAVSDKFDRVTAALSQPATPRSSPTPQQTAFGPKDLGITVFDGSEQLNYLSNLHDLINGDPAFGDPSDAELMRVGTAACVALRGKGSLATAADAAKSTAPQPLMLPTFEQMVVTGAQDNLCPDTKPS